MDGIKYLVYTATEGTPVELVTYHDLSLSVAIDRFADIARWHGVLDGAVIVRYPIARDKVCINFLNRLYKRL